jgi:hypothetical protein
MDRRPFLLWMCLCSLLGCSKSAEQATVTPEPAPDTPKLATVKQVTVHCDIKHEDKEKPGSFKFQVKKDGKVLYERSGFGLEEGWDDDTSHQTSSDDMTGVDVPVTGRYTFIVDIDNGKRIDVESEWYVDILGTDGRSRTSAKNLKFFRNQETHWEVTFDIHA